MHNLLKRQFKKVFTESFQIPKKWQEFTEAVNNAYIEFDTDRRMLERSLELSSQELLQANSEIMAERNKLRSIIDAMDYGLTIQDLEYKIIFQNDVLKDIFGNRLGEKCHIVYEGKEKVCDGCPVEMAYKDNKAHTSERKIIMPSGEVAFWENTANPIRDAGGKIVSCIEIVRNITERKRLGEQLHQAQKMESVGQLAGGVAHDFNNLLTAIIGYGNLLKTEVSQDNLLLAYVTQILNSAKRAADLTHNLLAFSRKQIINPRPVNVNNIITNMKTFLAKIISEDIDISIFPADQDLTVMADKHQIEQIMMNLVTNARDAMPDGGSLTIRTEYKEVDKEFIEKHGYVGTGAYALISVEDAGQGMNEETKERLFDPFYTTKEVGKGTGLGLSMVYGIIKQHNGYIDVQSELGKGTTFNIYLPLTTLTVEEDKKPKDLPILKGGTETILLAEDETYVRDFIKGILTGYGYKVIAAIDGEDAIKVLHTHKDKIELAILDVIMPKKNGEMVHQEIKKVSPHMKVIFISGYATDILYKKGIIEEGINFISKPMSPDELLIKVREVLDS